MGAVLCKLCGTVCMTACCDPCGGGCMSKNVPWLPHHLTAKIITQWLQDKGGLELDNAAATVALQPFAIGEGLMSIMYRVTVTYIYPPKNGLNTTFVCKLSPPAAKPRFIGALLSLFKSEVNFYNKNLRESTGMDSPLCYYAGVASNGRYCILLEDLSPAKAGKQIEGVSIENARDATRCLATFHAKYHGKVRSDATFDEWLLLADDTEYWKLVKGSYDGACPTLQSRIDTIFKTTFEGDDPKGFSRVALTFKDNYDKYIALMVLNATSSKSTSKTTLTHGDFRAENMFFNAPTTMGESKDNDKGGMRLVDFQLMKESSGPAELCYFIGTSMTIEDRRKYECELLQLYYDEMKANGADISMQDVLLEYQAGCTTMLVIYTIAQKDTQVDSERAKELIRVSQQRAWAQIQDLGYENAMKLVWSLPIEEVCGRVWSEKELKEMLPEKYLALCGSDGKGESSTDVEVASGKSSMEVEK